MALKTKSKPIKGLVVGLIVAIAAILIVLLPSWKANSLIPGDIKKQLNFTAIYPASSSGVQINQSSFSYQASENVLSITIGYAGGNVILTEQKAPDNVAANTVAANQQLGVHPYTQFQSKLGLVSLTKLYQKDTFTAQGELGVLVAKGTLILAHSDRNLSTDQWQKFFENIR